MPAGLKRIFDVIVIDQTMRTVNSIRNTECLKVRLRRHAEALKEFYTNTSAKDILEHRSLIATVTDDALADNRPLWNRVAQEADQAFLDEIAVEYEKGRLPLIATVDLDARQGVLWNMTRIAASGDPTALDLFRSIMVASASIPGAFPPTMIDVEAGGQAYQEMHVDGGTMLQVFVYPPRSTLKRCLQT